MMTPPAPLSKGEKRRCWNDEVLVRRRLFLGLSLALKSRIVSTLAEKWVENEPMGGREKADVWKCRSRSDINGKKK